MPELEAVKERRNGKSSKNEEARASTTDPDARRMTFGNGAVGPGLNVQFATDTARRAIVAVEAIHRGHDQAQSDPLRKQAEKRMGREVEEHRVDGGYAKRESIEKAALSGVGM